MDSSSFLIVKMSTRIQRFFGLKCSQTHHNLSNQRIYDRFQEWGGGGIWTFYWSVSNEPLLLEQCFHVKFFSCRLVNHVLTRFYERDYVTVVAARKIEAGEEVENCYGVDWRLGGFLNISRKTPLKGKMGLHFIPIILWNICQEKQPTKFVKFSSRLRTYRRCFFLFSINEWIGKRFLAENTWKWSYFS